MSDIVEKLRLIANEKAQNSPGTGAFEYTEWQAAEEITLLRSRLEAEKEISKSVIKQLHSMLQEKIYIDPKYMGREDED